MAKAVKTTFSKHALEDRADRLVFIAQYIGWGNVILEVPSRTSPDVIEQVTDTAIIIIRSSQGVLITAYPASMSRCLALYRDAGIMRLPDHLVGRISKNLKLMKKHKFVG